MIDIKLITTNVVAYAVAEDMRQEIITNPRAKSQILLVNLASSY